MLRVCCVVRKVGRKNYSFGADVTSATLFSAELLLTEQVGSDRFWKIVIRIAVFRLFPSLIKAHHVDDGVVCAGCHLHLCTPGKR